MPVYNSARFLEESVNSVLSSSFKSLELILVDDGSTDGSGPLCDRLAFEDDRITVVHQPNGGVSRARNRGIDAAKGIYVAFVDSDDKVDPGMYEKLILAAAPDCDIVFCDMLLHYYNTDLPEETFALGKDRSQTIGNLLMSGRGGGPCHMIVKRNLIGTLRFPEHIHSGEDLWFTLRLFSSAGSMTKVNEPLYVYNQENNDSITHSTDTKMEESILQGMRENCQFLKEAGLFKKVKREFYWSVLRYKSRFALDPERIRFYRTLFPESNKYLISCPLISFRVKGVMFMLGLHMDALVRIILQLYK